MANSSTLMRSAIDVADRAAARVGALRAASYLRVSTEQQTFGYGIAKSEKKTSRFIQRKGWEHVATFSDDGVSGSLEMGSRPDFDRLMELAGQNPRPFEVVVVEEGRAIGRTGRAFWRWVWALEDIGIYVAIVDGDIDNTTPAGRREMRRAADYAETEWETIRIRTQGGLQEKAESGGWIGGVPPYGYQIHLQGKKGESHLVLCFKEARCLRRARAVYVQMKRPSWRQTAMQINREGWRTRSGKPWRHQNLRERITSQATLESAVIFRNVSDGKGGVGHKTKVNPDGTPTHGDSVVIQLDPIFAPWEVGELRAAIARGARSPRSGRNPYPLSGRVFNTHDGCGAHYRGAGRTDTGVRIYVCSGKDESYPGAEICSCSQVNADVLEARVWQEIQELLGDPEKLLGMATDWVEIATDHCAGHDDRVEDLDRQIEVQNKALAAVVAMAAKEAAVNGQDAEKAIGEASGILRKELEELKQLRREADEWRTETVSAGQRITDIRLLADMARENLADMSPEGKAEFIELLDVKVKFTGPVPQGRKGRPCTLADWFRERGRLVPRELSDAEWAAIEPLMPGKPRGYTYRQLIDGVLYKARTGVLWSELPAKYGKFLTIHARASSWLRNGLWDRIMDEMKDADGSPVPSMVVLPPMEVSGRIDPSLMPWVHELTPAATGAKTASPSM
ncbi:recombinase family protein [Streptomyces sp. NPDC050636]|uniref:recombinase family protein n=1 Tax=Streptomyces sp. NPDC050636 TaxID=3154510 RepID=UPI003441B378